MIYFKITPINQIASRLSYVEALLQTQRSHETERPLVLSLEICCSEHREEYSTVVAEQNIFCDMTYPYLLLTISIAGIFSNVASLFIFAKQKFRKIFHRLLVILAIYDLAVSRKLMNPDVNFW